MMLEERSLSSISAWLTKFWFLLSSSIQAHSALPLVRLVGLELFIIHSNECSIVAAVTTKKYQCLGHKDGWRDILFCTFSPAPLWGQLEFEYFTSSRVSADRWAQVMTAGQPSPHPLKVQWQLMIAFVMMGAMDNAEPWRQRSRLPHLLCNAMLPDLIFLHPENRWLSLGGDHWGPGGDGLQECLHVMKASSALPDWEEDAIIGMLHWSFQE